MESDVNVRVEIRGGVGTFTMKPKGIVTELINYDKPENYILLEIFDAIKNGGGDFSCKNL